MIPCFADRNERRELERNRMGNRRLAARFLSRLLWLLGCGAAPSAFLNAANAVTLAPPPYSIIHAGHLWAAPDNKPPLDRATLVVQGAKIKEIRDGYLDAAVLNLPADTQVIDLTGMFVMHGFTDLHVHLSGGAEGGRDL